jgi:tripartite-type tricarboxylate transporter receptor subunit TctC
METHVLNGAFYSLPYDVLNDLVPISPLVTAPVVLFARKTMPANDLNEFIAWLKANPNKASAGVLSLASRLITMFLQRETSTAFVLVPYRGGAPGVQDLAAGQIDFLFATPDQLSQMRAGNIKAFPLASCAQANVGAPVHALRQCASRVCAGGVRLNWHWVTQQTEGACR